MEWCSEKQKIYFGEEGRREKAEDARDREGNTIKTKVYTVRT